MSIELFPVSKKQHEISPLTNLSLPEMFELLAKRVDAMPLDKLVFKANQHVIGTSIDNMQCQIEEEREMNRLDAVREKMKTSWHCIASKPFGFASRLR
jgi:hypothetical protein